MTAAFFATLAVALVLVAVLVWRERSRRGVLEQARRDVSASSERAEEAARLRDEAEAAVQEQIEATATRTAELEAAMGEQAASADARVAELQATSNRRIEELERSVRDTEDKLSELQASDTGRLAPGTSWRLLLARVERQWADAVNAGAGERGVVDAPAAEQLVQAVRRDLERLREEVGVETAMTPGEPAEDHDPLTTLLAVGEAVALLAYHSEHVQVDLRDPAVVSGQDWTGDDDARRLLEHFVAVASDVGRDATVEIGDDSVRVVLGVRTRSTS